jgi:NADH:ubiquinone oxidoreductase subunit H
VVLKLKLEETQKQKPMPAPMPMEKKKPNRNRNNKSHVKHPNLADARAVVVAAWECKATLNLSPEVMPLQTVDAVNANARRSREEVVVVVVPWMTLPRMFPEVMLLAELAIWSRTPLDRPSTKSETQLVTQSAV